MQRSIMAAIEEKETNRESKLQYVTVAVMLLALFVRNAFGFGIPVIVLLGIMILPVLLGTDNNLWATAVSCIPFSTGFQYKYVLFASLVVFLLRRRGRLKKTRTLFFVFLLMLWEFFHIVMGQFSLYEYLRCFAELIVVVIISAADMNRVNYKLILRTLAISTVGVCFIMLYIQLSQADFSLASIFGNSYHNYRFGAGNTDAINFGLNFNANGLGFVCSLSLTSMLVLYERKEHTAFDIIIGILAALFGLLTLSRTYIVCLVFVMIGVAVGASGSVSRKAKKLFGLVCMVLIILLLVFTFVPDVYNNLVLRFGEEDLLNGRDSLLNFYFKHIFSSPLYLLFGIGLQDFQGKLIDIYGGYVQVCHNGFQEVWVTWGIVGVVLFCGMIFAMMADSKKFSGKRSLSQYIPLLLMLLYTSAGQLIRSELALLSLVVIYVSLSIPKIKERLGIV